MVPQITKSLLDSALYILSGDDLLSTANLLFIEHQNNDSVELEVILDCFGGLVAVSAIYFFPNEQIVKNHRQFLMNVSMKYDYYDSCAFSWRQLHCLHS